MWQCCPPFGAFGGFNLQLSTQPKPQHKKVSLELSFDGDETSKLHLKTTLLALYVSIEDLYAEIIRKIACADFENTSNVTKSKHLQNMKKNAIQEEGNGIKIRFISILQKQMKLPLK